MTVTVTRQVPVFRPISTPPAGRHTFNDAAGTRIDTREPFATGNFAAAAKDEYFAFEPAASSGFVVAAPPDALAGEPAAGDGVVTPAFTPATLNDFQSVQLLALSLTRT